MNYIHLPTRVRDCESPVDATWALVDIQQKVYSNSTYKINVYVDNNNTVFMKPHTAYYSREFEELFGFGIMCREYDENKVIQVISPKNYSTNFK